MKIKVIEATKTECLRFEASAENPDGTKMVCTFANIGHGSVEGDIAWSCRVFEPTQNVYQYPTIIFGCPANTSLEKVAAIGWYNQHGEVAEMARRYAALAELLEKSESDWSKGRVNE